MIIISGGFPHIADEIKELLLSAPLVKTERWQGVKANQETRELRNVVFEVDLRGEEDITHWVKQITPNLPWADNHFLERVGGHPINPGKEWANWPFISPSAFKENNKYNHNYMERLWPKYAKRTDTGELPIKNKSDLRAYPDGDKRPRFGINAFYGDLEDLVRLLIKEPYSRQAYIPLFFPEDTGIGDGGRKPCTLGYQFLVRSGKLHLWYPLRSCDYLHHWRDDCYLAIKLMLWVLEQCRKVNPEFWDEIKPGTFSMHCTSLHVFESKIEELRK
jgi:hypothetical protein